VEEGDEDWEEEADLEGEEEAEPLRNDLAEDEA